MRIWWLVCALLVSGTAFAGSPAQVAQAFEDQVLPGNNAYGSHSEIIEADGVLHARTKCGGYVAIVLQRAYDGLTVEILRGLTGSTSPTSKQWRNAIETGAAYTEGAATFRMRQRETIDQVTSGDVFASEYKVADATGHTMIIDSKRLDATNVATTIPGIPTANRWLVRVHDSTSAPHGASDSRAESRDDGIGNGWIYVFTDAETGVIVGWTWSTSSKVTYQTTEPMAPNYRPVAVGHITGPGI